MIITDISIENDVPGKSEQSTDITEIFASHQSPIITAADIAIDDSSFEFFLDEENNANRKKKQKL